MKSKKAKQLRRLAERMTIGKSERITKEQYKRLKEVHKQTKGEL